MAADFNIRQERVSPADKDFENALRPLRFSDFSGQRKVVENLEVFVEAAKYRGGATRPYPAAWASWIGEDHLEQYHRQ